MKSQKKLLNHLHFFKISRNYLKRFEVSLLILAALTGIGGGFGAVIFRLLITGFTTLSFQHGSKILNFLGNYYIIFIPAIGGMVVGFLVNRFARETKGHGVPEVMESIMLKGGKIRPRVAIIKSLASSICIGSGGSVGREGPIVQIGSAIGSTLGQIFKLGEEQVRNLVACGAAAGIAASFNARIGGVLFASEVILGEFATTTFITIVISSVSATIISRIFLGNKVSFLIPAYSFVNPIEILFYVILGVLAAFIGLLFTKLLYKVEDGFNLLKISDYLKPVIGGLTIGIIGFFFPQIFGVGYETIELALAEKLALGTVISLMFLKLLATSITLGSGGSGGIFAPSLVIGSMLGNFFGTFIHSAFPEITASPGAYALVSMAALFSAAAHAPITAIIILFEMTGAYNIILPLMATCVIATLITRRMSEGNIYTLKLIRRGIHILDGMSLKVRKTLTAFKIKDIMTKDVVSVTPNLSLERIYSLILKTDHHGFPVIENGKLVGLITVHDLVKVPKEKWGKMKVKDAMVKHVETISTENSLYDAIRLTTKKGVGRLIVVSKDDPNKVVGIITKTDLVKAYNTALLVTY